MVTKHNSFRRGVTLVELMIAMLILAIVCVSWLEIIGIQSARKEARRREAVERLAGMMDAFLYDQTLNNSGIVSVNKKTKGRSYTTGIYSLSLNGNDLDVKTVSDVQPMYEDGSSPIGYLLRVVPKTELEDNLKFGNGWVNKSSKSYYWLVGELYNHHGEIASAGKPFFTLPVCLGL